MASCEEGEEEVEQASSSSRITCKEFIKEHQEEFIDSVPANNISFLLSLVTKEIISDTDRQKYSKGSANKELFLHMKGQGTVESLKNFYTLCKDCTGYPKLIKFGEKMLELLDERKPIDKLDKSKRDDSSTDSVEPPPPKKPTTDKTTPPTMKAVPPSSSKGTSVAKKDKLVKKAPKGLQSKPGTIVREPGVVEEIRNVVLLGNSGAGKSTVGNRILGICEERAGFKTGSTLDPVTRDIRTIVSVRPYTHGRRLRISVTDTIGLFDKKLGKGIMNKVREHVQRHYKDTGLTMVLFVLSNGRFLDHEKDIYDCIMKHCDTDDAKSMTALVITHCENVEEEKKEDYITKFRQGKQTKDLVDFVRLGIHLVGFPDFSACSETIRQNLEAALKDSMLADEEHLLQIIAENSETKMVGEIMRKSWWEKCALF